MPNPAVKPVSVDGTMWGTHGRADRRQFRLKREEVFMMRLPLFVVLTGLFTNFQANVIILPQKFIKLS